MNNVHVGIQRRRDPVGLVRADAAEARWEVTVDVVDRDGSIDFRGPEVQGKPGERFIYLTCGEVGPVHQFEMFRRAKVMLNRVAPDLIESARTSGTIVASIDLTGDDGAHDVPGWTHRRSLGRSRTNDRNAPNAGSGRTLRPDHGGSTGTHIRRNRAGLHRCDLGRSRAGRCAVRGIACGCCRVLGGPRIPRLPT